MMMNPKLLATFCTLVETKHFTRTAEKLFMTQSGVSQHVRKLEQELDVELIARDAHEFTLTPAGERLYRESKPLVEALQQLPEQVQQDPPFNGVIRVMSPGSVGLQLYPYLLDLQEQHPAMHVDFRFAPNKTIEESIVDKAVDIGLVTQAPQHQDIAFYPIAQERLLLVTPKRTTVVNYAELQELGFINHPDGTHHGNLLLSANFNEHQQVTNLPHHGFSNQIHLILEPVRRGLGFTVLPEHAVNSYVCKDAVCIQPLPHEVHETIYLATHRLTASSNRVASVRTAIEAWFQQRS